MSRPRKPPFHQTLNDKTAPPIADTAIALVTTNTAAQPPPPIPNYLRFADLKARGIVNNWVTLQNWINHEGFPPGILVGPKIRIFAEPLVQAWLDARRDVKNAPRGAARAKHEAKEAQKAKATARDDDAALKAAAVTT
jgi:hypothetical protein